VHTRNNRRIILTAAFLTGALLCAGGAVRAAESRPLLHATVPDRRIVDVVEAGNPDNELRHGFAADSTVAGSTGGKAWRRTFGWMHYTLKTFEDTPVTLSLTFIADANPSSSYDVVVEDSVVASRTHAGRDSVAVVDIAVPFGVTKGKAHIAVIVRARNGATPAVHTIRTIQDHFEEQELLQQFEQSKVPLMVHPSGVAR
jgi:hypothetical protein